MNERVAPEFLTPLRAGKAKEAWVVFLRHHTTHLYRVIARFARDEESRSDCFVFVCDQLAAQDCRRLRRFEPDGSAVFTTWLHSVVYNLCLDWKRTRRPRLRLVSFDELAPAAFQLADSGAAEDDPALRVAEQIDQARLGHAVQRLPPDDRLMIRLRYEKDLTLAEVARLCGLVNAQAADRRLRAIIAVLKAELLAPPAEKSSGYSCHESGPQTVFADRGGN